MDERGSVRRIFNAQVYDDGWKPPYEVIEEIELRIGDAKRDAYRYVVEKNKKHKGDWLTKEVARQYAAKSWIYRVIERNQYCGKVREIGEELQRLYGVTEIEAINILFERNVDDYVNKYYRIQHRIPVYVNAQAICDDMAYEYLVKMEV